MALKRLAAVLALTAGAACGPDPGRAHLSDADLRANFTAHRGAFERLLVMTREDPRFYRIANTWVGASDLSNEDAARALTPRRWSAYRRLFREADLPEGLLVARDEPGLVLFLSSTEGILGGSMKGYAHSSRPPENVVTSLDDTRALHLDPPRGEVGRAFVPLGDGWFLVYEVS